MSYLVLARKWRPLTFADLVGQSHISRTLEKAILAKRVAHAFLFTGTRGVGKTTTARILAMALNCEKGPAISPCGVCHSCKDIKNGVGLDVLEIDGASNRGIDEIRSLRETIAYTPSGGRHRIVIIDEVHMLTREAFNALLKSLEEPPPDFIFIFATTEPHKVPETILSRVQRYDFKRISPADIFGRLKAVCDAETIPFEEEALWMTAREAGGSMRDALTLLDQIIPFCDGKITSAEARNVLGLVNRETLMGLFDAIRNRDEAALLGIVSRVFTEGYDMAGFAARLEEHVRHLLISRVKGMDPEIAGLSGEEMALYRTQSMKFEGTDLLRMQEILFQLAARMGRSVMPRFELETALLKLVHLDDAVDISEFLRNAASGEVKKKTENALTDAAVSSGTIRENGTAREFNFVELKARWHEQLSALMNENARIGTYLSYSFILNADEKEIRIGIPKSMQFQYQQLVRPEQLHVLIDFFRNRYGYGGRVSVEAVEDEKSGIHLGPERASVMKEAVPAPVKEPININEAVRREPIIGTLLDMFNGEVR